jgi:hypothetical protein
MRRDQVRKGEKLKAQIIIKVYGHSGLEVLTGKIPEPEDNGDRRQQKDRYKSQVPWFTFQIDQHTSHDTGPPPSPSRPIPLHLRRLQMPPTA